MDTKLLIIFSWYVVFYYKTPAISDIVGLLKRVAADDNSFCEWCVAFA